MKRIELWGSAVESAEREIDGGAVARENAPPTFWEAAWTWAYVGLNSFGGPAGQIAVMHRVVVEEKKWISEERFLHALNYCMLLPGPEATQLATYIGWLLHGTRGGLVAGTLFVIPGIVAMMALSYLYAGFEQVTLVQSLFFGVKAAVLAVVAEAVVRIGKRALKSRFQGTVAALAFIAIFFFNVPFPAIVFGAGLLGWLWHRGAPQPEVGERTPVQRPSIARTVRVLCVGLTLWLGPLIAVALVCGPKSVYTQTGAFFSEAAVVTFGGAYAVLAYIAQEAVNTYHWMRPGEMLDGLALAETTPGPLIMVVQFVGFLAAFRSPGALPPMVAGTLAALLTTWVTFAPCFLWIFLGAPYIEALRGNKSLNAALSTITAAVVGVVLNLGVWFTLHTIFANVDERHVLGARLLIPQWHTVQRASLVLAAGALIATFKYHVDVLKVIGVCAGCGIVWNLLVSFASSS